MRFLEDIVIAALGMIIGLLLSVVGWERLIETYRCVVEAVR